ncbi:MAG TPA: CGNR zinc finger domain-containing protein, partial [Candidatus Dormibacteraeota bacterium]|nr:CGNR zinc finger domain-containing protein [Candidatus Dormibacteraeota bacterium]
EADGSWARLKACPAQRCHWAFFDASRNRSGTWCTMAVCGTRAKARSYQRRLRASRDRAAAPAPPRPPAAPSAAAR